jgi:hypothetical protein
LTELVWIGLFSSLLEQAELFIDQADSEVACLAQPVELLEILRRAGTFITSEARPQVRFDVVKRFVRAPIIYRRAVHASDAPKRRLAIELNGEFLLTPVAHDPANPSSSLSSWQTTLADGIGRRCASGGRCITISCRLSLPEDGSAMERAMRALNQMPPNTDLPGLPIARSSTTRALKRENDARGGDVGAGPYHRRSVLA